MVDVSTSSLPPSSKHQMREYVLEEWPCDVIALLHLGIDSTSLWKFTRGMEIFMIGDMDEFQQVLKLVDSSSGAAVCIKSYKNVTGVNFGVIAVD